MGENRAEQDRSAGEETDVNPTVRVVLAGPRLRVIWACNGLQRRQITKRLCSPSLEPDQEHVLVAAGGDKGIPCGVDPAQGINLQIF